MGTLREGDRIGNLRIRELVGEGGIGEVYLAFDETLKREVAVKALRRDRMTVQTRSRFLVEARVLSQLDHANVCRIYDFIEGEETDHLVLEWIRGRTLQDALRDGKLALAEVVRIFEQVTAALVAAHRQGIVHRDLKPANVMLTGERETHVKVLDFGLARSTDRETPAEPVERPQDVAPIDDESDPWSSLPGSTELGDVVGTPANMSPEQARGDKVSAASDMYSLGLLMQEAATGRPAREPSRNRHLLLARAARGESLPVAGVDAELKALIEELEALAPEARPTAAETARRLAWIRERPKRRLRAWAIAALVGAALLFAVVVGLQNRRIGREARRATEALERTEIATRIAVAENWTEKDPTRAVAALLEIDRLEENPVALSRLYQALRHEVAFRELEPATGVSAVRFSPQGDRIAIATAAVADRVLRIWDLDGAAEPLVLDEDPGFVFELDWSPDGRRLLSVGVRIRVWEVAADDSHAPARRRPAELEGVSRAWDGQWSPDGTRVALALEDGTVRIWDPEGKAETIVLAGHAENRVTWSPDGRRLLTTSWKGTARVWKVRRLAAEPGIEPLVLKHGETLVEAAWSPDGRRFATLGADGLARVWTLREEGGAERVDEPLLLRVGPGQPRAVAWSPDGRRLAAATSQETFRVWDLSRRDAKVESSRELTTSGRAVSLVWHPREDLFLAGATDGTARIWDLRDGRSHSPPRLFRTLTSAVTVRWSPRGDRVATTSNIGKARIWNLPLPYAARRRLHRSLPIVHGPRPEAVTAASWRPGGDEVVTSTESGESFLWNPDGTGRALLPASSAPVYGGAGWSPDGRHLAAVTQDGGVRILTVTPEGVRENVVVAGGGRAIRRLRWSPDSTRLVVVKLSEPSWLVVAPGAEGGPFRSLLLPEGRNVGDAAWIAETSRFVTYGAGEIKMRGRDGNVLSEVAGPDGARLALSPDGRSLLVGDSSSLRALDILDTELRERWRRQLDTPVFGRAWSPDGPRVALGTDAGTIQVLDPRDGKELLVLKGHSRRVTEVHFDPSGTRLVSRALDGSLRLWDVRRWPAEAESPRPSPSLLFDRAKIAGPQAWSRDGRRLLTFSGDEAVAWWADPAEVVAVARASFQTCLDPEIRESAFDEPPQEARERYLACERSHGRRPVSR